MRARAERLLGGGFWLRWVGTFHSLGVRILRREGHRLGYGRDFTIFDSDDQLGIIKGILKEKNLDDKQFPPRQVLSMISRAKNEGQSPEKYRAQYGDYFREQTAGVWIEYQARLKRADGMDFDDILLNSLAVMVEHAEVREHYAGQFRQLLVDEYQDTNDPQYRFVKLLTSIHGNLCAVGDEDQSIYRWRGATIENILRFERDFPGAQIIRLERNYRSTQHILDAAMSVVSLNKNRLGKKLFTDKSGGDKILSYEAPTGRAEAEWVIAQVEKQKQKRPISDLAILYRTNAQSRPFEEILIGKGIPYQVIGGQKFYERREIRDLIAYARLALNPSDDPACKRIINVPARGLGKTTLAQLEQLAAERNIPLLAAAAAAVAENKFSARAHKPLAEFAALMCRLSADLPTLSPAPFFDAIIAEIHYFEFLESEYGPTGDHEGRIDNVNELITGARGFAPAGGDCRQQLAEFLEKYALASDQDEIEEEGEKLTLMTVHSAKGLEYPLVFIVGLEQSLFPHSRAAESEADLEEERRLFYVAVTRARERVHLSRARYRARYGGYEEARERSQFWDEIPAQLIEEISPRATPQYAARPGMEQGGDSMGNLSAFFGGGAASEEHDFDQRPQAERRPTIPNRPLLAPASSFPAPAAKAAPRDRLRPGARVQHGKFGYGIVLFKEGEGEEAQITISFTGYGRKKLALKYAGLKFL
jgi:DNA helicase-2/ATP-dependent DNA helicase PcrA